MVTPARRLGVAIVVVGLAAVVVAGGSTVAAREKRTTFTGAPSITAVEVELDSGRVDVVATTDLETRIRQITRSLFGAPKLQQLVTDGVLRPGGDCPRLSGPPCEVRYRLEHPATIAVRARTDHGSISVEGMAGIVDVAAGAGGISLVRTSGPVTARTGGGKVDIGVTEDAMSAYVARARSEAGGLRIRSR